MEGWIRIHRQLLDSEIFASEKGLKIWVWLLLKATYKTSYVNVKIGYGEKTVTLQRGQLLFGRFTAEESIQINGSTIYKILKKMELMDMIKVESNSHYTIITICNFDKYNPLTDDEVAANEQPHDSHVTAEEQPRNTNNNSNKDNKDNNANNLFIRKENFKNEIFSFENEFEEEKLNLFFDYWSEETHDKQQMRFELEKVWNTYSRITRFKPMSDN